MDAGAEEALLADAVDDEDEEEDEEQSAEDTAQQREHREAVVVEDLGGIYHDFFAQDHNVFNFIYHFFFLICSIFYKFAIFFPFFWFNCEKIDILQCTL